MGEKSAARKILESQYHAYIQLLEDHGIHYPIVPQEDLDKMPDTDLTRHIRAVRDLARTPTA